MILGKSADARTTAIRSASWLGNGYHDSLLTTAEVIADAVSCAAFESSRDAPKAGGRCAAGKGSRRFDCAGEFFVDAAKSEEAVRKARFEIGSRSRVASRRTRRRYACA